MSEQTILIVDDEKRNVKLLEAILAKEYRILSANSGREALAVVDAERPDLILLDVMMPGMDGIQVCRTLKSGESTRMIPIIIVTSLSDKEDRVQAYEAGADDFLSKPVDRIELLGRTKSLLRIKAYYDREVQYAKTLDHANIRLREELESHRRTAAALEASENLYRAIVEDQTGFICRFSRDYKIIFVNEALCRALGKSRDDLLGESVHAILSGDLSREIIAYLSSLEQGTKKLQYEFTVETTRWGPRTILWTGRALLHDLGGIAEYQVVGQDITQIRLYEEEIRKSRDVLRSVLDSISEPLIMVDEKMSRILANCAADEYYDVTDHDLESNEVLDHFRHDDNGELLKEIQSSVRASTPLRREIGPVYTGDNVAYEEVSVYPVRMCKQEAKRSIIRISDITERRLLEKRMAQQEKVETMSIFIASLLHQINNPNNFIIFNIPILKEYIQNMISVIDHYACHNQGLEISGMSYGEFREDVTGLLNTIEKGSIRINTTMLKLQEFAREQVCEEPESVNLGAVIRKAISLCEGEVKKTIKVMDVYVEPGLPRIRANQESLTLVVINILTNAAEAANKEESKVTLNIRRDELSDDFVIIEISDNGCGMDDMTREKIFDAFFTTNRRHDGTTIGTGLGLHVTKNLVEKMGARIVVESIVNEGSTFKIMIPAQRQANITRNKPL